MNNVHEPHDIARPHDYDHHHSDTSSGWLRATVFGAMDGLVSNSGLIAGIAAAGASNPIVAITGISGLIAGAVSMALGEFTSVRTANEQLDAEVRTEREAHARNPEGEQAELTALFTRVGMSAEIANLAAAQVHKNDERAVRVHITHELGLNLEERPSPLVAAVSSFLSFAIGAFIPIIPFVFGFGNLWIGLAFGGVGLLVAGGLAAVTTKHNWLWGSVRQLIFGGIAVAATYTIGTLLGVSEIG
ncbi:VIT1/CCC1 transporter family protein [Leucobacter denitrificans]|uniref:VIT1/CCC1 transporter family protein n=1 Tax=Leucobacter denitrificans TaxID=683042 RepID=A0A7G9S3T5_9MICO|nr:VIT1/CCC1 transporter family protein [Leucobacter denitrificans]QNN62510.1 VIT1/CCC1 transporter family protein [Leucobacter denitrificans]